MSKIWALAKRELAAYFYSPLAYVIGAMFLCVCGFKFANPPFWSGREDFFILVPHQVASLRSLFEMMGVAMTVAAPLLTMRLISEEFRSGTAETLLTAPITDTQIVLGKFLGVMLFYLTLLAATGAFLLIMAFYARPDYGVVAMGYVGMILLGAAFLSVGLFASTLSRYQLLCAAVAIVILSLMGVLLTPAETGLPGMWSKLAGQLNAQNHLSQFARGLLGSAGVVYFISITAGFLFLSVKMVESKRWR